MELFASFFNLFVLVGFLVYKLRAPLKQFVHQRHLTMKDELSSVAEQLKNAQDKFNEFTVKLKSVSAEVSSIREQSKADAAAMKQRILSEARRNATNVVSDSKSVAEGLFFQLQGQLYTELSHKVVDRAETVLRERLTGDDRARIRQEFSRQVETIR